MNLPLKSYWELLSRHIRPQRGRFALLTVLLFSSIGLQVVNPQIMRFFIDTALGGGALQTLMQAAAAFIGIALLQQVVGVSVTYLGESVAWTATNALRAELAWHCLNLDMGFHNAHRPGELIERIDGDVTEMSNFFSQFVVTLLGNLLLMIGILIALFIENWPAGLGFSLFVLIALVALNRVRDIAIPHQNARRQAEADLFGYVEEQLNGTEDIRSNGAVDFSLRELLNLQANILRHNRKAHQKGWIISTMMGALLAGSTILAVVVGYNLYTASVVTIGTVYLFIRYINLLDAPLWTLTHEIESFQTIGACVARLSELRKLQPRVRDSGDTTILLPDGPLALAFDNVTFRYDDAPVTATLKPADLATGDTAAAAFAGAVGKTVEEAKPTPEQEMILQNISFRLEPGKVIGLLGRTGSGKTTLTRLVFRLYDPASGRIYLDGKEVRQVSLETLRKRIGIVTQEVQLFRASVRDNLTFFDPSISDERILAVLDELELSEWYHSLPNGLDTLLQSGGHSLSAGEAQLLAFARIFLRNPGLVILDEASSRLDPATEQRIERAIDRLLKGRTAIIVAHRLGTVQRADEIMILESGRICEQGNRVQLARDPDSQFYHLLQTGLEEVLA